MTALEVLADVDKADVDVEHLQAYLNRFVRRLQDFQDEPTIRRWLNRYCRFSRRSLMPR